MDFLITTSDIFNGVVENYSQQFTRGEFKILVKTSGNLVEFEDDAEPAAFSSGPLFGALRNSRNLHSESNEALRKKVLKSNGSFTLAIPEENRVRLVTDASGSIPTYYGYGPNGFAVGTKVHHVAYSTGLEAIDYVSVVDYLLNETVCYPYSWYEDVQLVPPGTIAEFRPENCDFSTYWRPVERDHIQAADCDEALWGKRLHDVIEDAVEKGLNRKSKARVLYSAGSDARAVTSFIPSSFPCTPTTILDRKNREYRLAKLSAHLLGRQLDWLERPDDFYCKYLEERIDTIGPGWEFRRTHIFAPLSACFRDADVLFGGYLADTLFSSLYMGNVQNSLWHPEELARPEPDTIVKPNLNTVFELADWNELIAVVRERRLKHHEKLKGFRPQTAGHWHSLWPLAGQRPTYPHYLSTLRIGPQVIEPFLFHQSYRLASRMPDHCRVDRRAFCHAFNHKLGTAGSFPTQDGTLPTKNGRYGKLLRLFSLLFFNSLEFVLNDSGNQGAWPPAEKRFPPTQFHKYFEQREQKLLQHRLDILLPGNVGTRFLTNKAIRPSIRSRALALGFDRP